MLLTFWFISQYDNDIFLFSSFIAIFTSMGMEPPWLHADDGEVLVDFVMLQDPWGG